MEEKKPRKYRADKNTRALGALRRLEASLPKASDKFNKKGELIRTKENEISRIHREIDTIKSKLI